jgi:hypothetical protein
MKHSLSPNQQKPEVAKRNQKLVGEVTAVRSKLVGPGEAGTKVKADKTSAKTRSVDSLTRSGALR